MFLSAQTKSKFRSPLFPERRCLPYRLHLEALEDRLTPASLMVTNTNDSGMGSLRQAILDSNASVGVLDTIVFNIPGSGVQTIAPTSALPAITDPVIADGTTQPGYGGTPLIELNGANAGSNADALDINAGGSTIKGLAINRFLGNGISIVDSSNNLIQSNFIGTNAAGTAALGLGTLDNGSAGILIDGSLGPSGSNTIGGTAAGAGNLLSGIQGGSGVKILGSGAVQNLVQGNLIGVGVDGHSNLGNRAYGVWISTGASGNTIGGTVAGAGNTIWFNNFYGIWVDNSSGTMGVASRNGFLTNSIFENSGNGSAFLGPGGIWFNTPSDPAPTLDSALPAAGGGTMIKGSLQSTPNTTFRIEFFSNSIPDGSGFGQGQTFLGFQNVTTDGTGAVSFTAVVPANLPFGTAVSATATDPNNNTSKFSRDTPLFLTVTNTNDSGAGSLRQAILDSNASVGVLETIVFNIPGSGVHTIIPTSALPAITDTVIVDGTTQPGYAGKPLIELDGANAGSGVDGLDLVHGSDGSIVKGLVINRFSGDGIHIGPISTPGGTSNILIQSNFIGTNAAGTAALGNGSNGIEIIGFSPTSFSSHNTIGGTAAGAGNVISGNMGSGVEILNSGALQNVLQGNFIGTAVDGLSALGNGGNGVWLSTSASLNTVGGTAAGASNVIGFNGGAGVLVDNLLGVHAGPAFGDTILSNAIFANGGLGITLQPNANNNQTFPTLVSAEPGLTGGTLIKGSLQSTANTVFRIEFFSNAGPDPSGFGEGQAFLGFQNVTTDGSGNVSFTAMVPGSAAPGQAVSATATSPDPTNNTSQFSFDVTVNPIVWQHVVTGDFDGNGKQDIAGMTDSGQWLVGLSNGSSFINQQWTSWSSAVTWVDVHVGDFNGDGKADIVGRVLQTGQWWVAISNGTSFTNALWTTWNPNVTWVDVKVGNFSGDGKADIAGRWLQAGQWWVAQSDGSSFTNALWATWNPNVTWVDIQVGDFNGDRKADITGRYLQGGQWWTSLSIGSSFTTTLWTTWNPNVTWVDVQVGDFNGDGKDDIVGRYLQTGQWWAAISDGVSFANSLWTIWNPNVNWVDVRVGDFSGDKKDDIAGRVLQTGQWWVATSAGSSFADGLWTSWNPNVTWVDVQAGDFNGDGKNDITGRWSQAGQWWTAISSGSSFSNQLWTTWAP
jgi:hypothetical protein